jgi:two-component system KDP operon response regulator KdpE
MTKVLIADDSHVLRRLVEIALEPLGCEVYTAADAATAQDEVESVVPDVVLLDVGLPDDDGLSVLRWLRRNPRYDRVAVVIASGYSSQTEIDEATAAGADAYLAKPFSPTDVRTTVLSVVRTTEPQLS